MSNNGVQTMPENGPAGDRCISLLRAPWILGVAQVDSMLSAKSLQLLGSPFLLGKLSPKLSDLLGLLRHSGPQFFKPGSH